MWHVLTTSETPETIETAETFETIQMFLFKFQFFNKSPQRCSAYG